MKDILGSVSDLTVVALGNEPGDLSSKPGRSCLCFPFANGLRNGMNLAVVPSTMDR